MRHFCTAKKAANKEKVREFSDWPVNGALTGITDPIQSGLRGISNEEGVYIPKTSRIETSPSDEV